MRSKSVQNGTIKSVQRLQGQRRFIIPAYLHDIPDEGRTGRVMLSRNYPPSEKLAPFVRRHYVFEADLPADLVIVDRLLAETAFVRILLSGDWAGAPEPDNWISAGGAILFGANSRPLPVRVKGPFKVLGFSIKPGGWAALFDESANVFADRFCPLNETWGDVATNMFAALETATDDAACVAAMEDALFERLARLKKPREDLLMSKFEALARLDSTTRIDDISEQLGISTRQIERRCLRSFGISPKMIMRRSRFLDMATAMRGFSTPSEAELASLRYFDQSHLNREFKHFAGTTPGVFRRAETPLFTVGLKLRSEGESLFKL
jgi:AraC-like DNA-binding protein